MRVLLATDLSTQADKACALVARRSLPVDSSVHVVYAIEPIPAISAFADTSVLAVTPEDERQLRGELEKFASPIRSRDRSVEIVLRFGRAADVIVGEAQRFDADLIVVGNRGRGGIASMLLGSVSAEVIDRAPCPVLVARGERLTRILLADDGSESAAIGARVIAELPLLRALPVRVVSVTDFPFPYPAEVDPSAVAAARNYQELLPRLRSEHERIARERANSLTASGIAASWETREGDAAAEIIRAAEKDKSDLIVIGSRGQTGLTRFVIGSVARGVLFHAPCSVLVTHAPAVPVPDRIPAATLEHVPPKR
jgi:nucleotide-binding universal stress UspA family protein